MEESNAAEPRDERRFLCLFAQGKNGGSNRPCSPLKAA